MNRATINMDTLQKDIQECCRIIQSASEESSKVATVLEEAANATNLGSVQAISAGFQQLDEVAKKLVQDTEDVLTAAKKYTNEVAEIDEVDTSIYE